MNFIFYLITYKTKYEIKKIKYLYICHNRI